MKIGDRVKVIITEDYAIPGMIGTIKGREYLGDGRFQVEFDNKFAFAHTCAGLCKDGYGHNVPEEKLELINKTTIMKKLSNFYKKLVDADTQALVKAGYLNGDLEPTEKATNALQEILFFDNKNELIKRAQEEIAEEEKNKLTTK